MSDTNEALPPIAPAGPDTPQATREAASALYAKHGYTADQLAAAGYAGTPAAPVPVQAPTVTTAPGTDVQIASPNDGLTTEQRLSGFRAVLKVSADKDAVIAEAAKAGISREQLGAVPLDPATVAAQQRNAEITDAFAPPADADGYLLQYGDLARSTDTAELAVLDTDYKSAFHHAGVPVAMAQPLLDAILETGEIYNSKSMTGAGRQLRWAEEGALFKKVSTDPAEDLRLATLGYNALPTNFRDQLDASHSLHSARAQFQLAALGRALEYRAGKRGSK